MLLCAFVLASPVVAQNGDDEAAQALAFFNKGQDAHEKGDLNAAIENYEKALKLVPDFPEAELQRGNAYQSLGKIDDAESAFRKALELRQDWSLAMANLGAVLVRKGQYIEAEKHLTKAIDLDEHNFPAYAALTELKLKTNADAKALRLLLARITLITERPSPTASIWASRAALEQAVGDRVAAKLSAARSVELEPKNRFALATAADIALTDGDPTLAEAYVKRLDAVDRQSESTNGLRARLLVAQGKNAEALELLKSIESPSRPLVDLKNQLIAASSTDTAELEKQLAIDPKSTALLGRLCSAYRVADPAKALDYCRRAAEAEPNSVQPVIGYAAALVQAKRYDEAVNLLRRLLSVAPDNSTARANLATALFQLKRLPEAKTEFRWLTEHQPDQAVAYYFLAIVHDQLLEFTDALANYQQFLRLADPESNKLEIEKVNLRLPAVQKLIKEGKGKKRG